MMVKCPCVPLVLAFQFISTDGFATTKATSVATKNNDLALDDKSTDHTSEFEADAADSIAGIDVKEYGSLNRRQFVVYPIIGAASLFVFSDEAKAITDSEPEDGFDHLSSTILVSDELTSPAPTSNPKFDTRAIIEKAGKKALGGGKGMLLFSTFQSISITTGGPGAMIDS